MVYSMPLWKELLIYAVIVIDLFVFVMLSKVRVNGVYLLSFKWRLVIAVLFPVIFLVAFFSATVLIAVIVGILIVLYLMNLFRRS